MTKFDLDTGLTGQLLTPRALLPRSKHNDKMAPKISEEEIDDLIYFSRSGEKEEFFPLLSSLADREKLSQAEILSSAKDQGQSTCLHMATGNGHLGEIGCPMPLLFFANVASCLLFGG